MSKRATTAFEAKVYAALERIPSGRVVSYGKLAEWVGVRSAQAIGQALKRNPDAPEVPCHRVLRRDGRIGGYQGAKELGSPSLKRKVELLRAEGVEFDAQGKLIDPERMLG